MSERISAFLNGDNWESDDILVFYGGISPPAFKKDLSKLFWQGDRSHIGEADRLDIEIIRVLLQSFKKLYGEYKGSPVPDICSLLKAAFGTHDPDDTKEKARKLEQIINEIEPVLTEKIMVEYKYEPINRVKKISTASMKWLSKQPGSDVLDRLYQGYQMLVENKKVDYNTYENRFMLFLVRNVIQALKNEGIRHPDDSDYNRWARKLRNRMKNLSIQYGITPVQLLLPPNVVLEYHPKYKKLSAFWLDWEKTSHWLAEKYYVFRHILLLNWIYLSFLAEIEKKNSGFNIAGFAGGSIDDIITKRGQLYSPKQALTEVQLGAGGKLEWGVFWNCDNLMVPGFEYKRLFTDNGRKKLLRLMFTTEYDEEGNSAYRGQISRCVSLQKEQGIKELKDVIKTRKRELESTQKQLSRIKPKNRTEAQKKNLRTASKELKELAEKQSSEKDVIVGIVFLNPTMKSLQGDKIRTDFFRSVDTQGNNITGFVGQLAVPLFPYVRKVHEKDADEIQFRITGSGEQKIINQSLNKMINIIDLLESQNSFSSKDRCAKCNIPVMRSSSSLDAYKQNIYCHGNEDSEKGIIRCPNPNCREYLRHLIPK